MREYFGLGTFNVALQKIYGGYTMIPEESVDGQDIDGTDRTGLLAFAELPYTQLIGSTGTVVPQRGLPVSAADESSDHANVYRSIQSREVPLRHCPEA